MYAQRTKIQRENESSRGASTGTGARLLDEAGEEVRQGLVVRFLIIATGACIRALFLHGSASLAVLG